MAARYEILRQLGINFDDIAIRKVAIPKSIRDTAKGKMVGFNSSLKKHRHATVAGKLLPKSEKETKRIKALTEAFKMVVPWMKQVADYFDGCAGCEEIKKYQTTIENEIKKLGKDRPVLLISGSEDPVGEYGKGVKKVYESMRKVTDDVTLKLYDTYRHEILNDSSYNEVVSDIKEFIKQ